MYLVRLALLVRELGTDEASKLLPLVARLKAELNSSKANDQLFAELAQMIRDTSDAKSGGK